MFRAKSKVQRLVSEKAEAKHLLSEVEWIKLTNPRHTDTDTDVKAGHAGEKRKATEDPEVRQSKRLRFGPGQVFKIRKQPDNTSEKKEEERLPDNSAIKLHGKRPEESGATDGEQIEIPPLPEIPRANARDDYPFPLIGLGKAILSTTQADQTWFSVEKSESMSLSLQATLTMLMASNENKIDLDACEYLQQLFSLLPLGVVGGSPVFTKALNRSIRELPLTIAQWGRIEIMSRDFHELDVSGNPDRFEQFGRLLNYITKIKNLLANEEQEKPTS